MLLVKSACKCEGQFTVAPKATTMYTFYATMLNAATLHATTSNIPFDVTRMFYAMVLNILCDNV